MKKLMLFLALVLISSLSFAQTIQYKDNVNDKEWQTLEYKDIKPGCLTGKEALKLSGDFSKFTVEWDKNKGTKQAYETGPVIAVCCFDGPSYTYKDEILDYIYKDPYYSCKYLKEVDLSEVTDINSMQYIFCKCFNLKTVTFPKNSIETAKNFEYAFEGCNSLQKADLSMFKNIDNLNEAFSNCFDMTEVKFCPKPVNQDVYIGNTFVGCINLKGIDLSMYKIKTDTKQSTPITFNACYSLDYVYLPQGYVDYVKSFLDKNKNNNDYKPQEDIFGGDYNPNCLKILPNDEQPKGVMDDWTNVVLGDEAFTDINLTEGFIKDGNETLYDYKYTYECPKDIQLGGKNAIFTPVMSGGPYTYQWANGESGWNTIVLPFTGALQTKGSNDTEYQRVYPATNNFKGHYWLREYKDGYGDAVTFDVVNNVNTSTGEALQANTPYIIAFPGNNFNDDSMESMDLRFIATTDVLPKTTDLKVNGDSKEYAFQGNLNGNQVSGTAYKLVYGGKNSQDYFQQTTNENLPFHAQIIATSGASTAKLLSINSQGTTGIVGTENEKPQETQTYFTIDGANTGVTDAKLLKKGVYIHGNKKILIK